MCGLGIDPPAALVALREDVAASVMAASGIPPPLLTENSDGTSQNSSYRRFVTSTIDPIGRIIVSETRDKLDQPDLVFNFARLQAADHAMRARAVASLVTAGVELSDALRYVALMED